MALFILALAGAIIGIEIFVAISLRSQITSMMEADVKGHVTFAASYADFRFPGDYRIDPDTGALWKGKENLSTSDSPLVFEIKAYTSSDVTIFRGDTRVATTLRDKSGKSLVGTKASAVVADTVLKQGKIFLGEADVVGEKFQSAYAPLRDRDGKIIGMLFTGLHVDTYSAEMRKTRLAIIVAGLFIIVLFGALLFWIVTRTLRPLFNLIDWTKSVSQGDLRAEFKDENKARDEVGELSWALREMITNLKQMIMLIQNTAGDTRQSAENLIAFSEQFSAGAQDQAAAAEEASAAMEEMAASAESVSERVSDSVQSMEAINQSLLLLSKSNQEVRGSMGELTGLSRSASEKARVGEEQIHHATDAMARIQDTAGKITEFVGIITEISDRTNLLSLNAAIEAARAGDAGRGFAVVAQEITKLADRTLESAKEVTTLIHAALDSIKKGTVQVDSVAGNLGGIVGDVQKIDRFAEAVMERISLQVIDTQNISDNASGLTATSTDMLTSLTEQKRATREIESTIGNVATTAQTVSSGTHELRTLATQLREKSEELLGTASRFQI
ncbi:MAG TPA: methyl-accepting chemotaxis protein [Leptospiraceae bacterium]|nr:methyl-accepting chemotaxis protein [Leptospirales bacterium]HMU82128.1 methyl-accepting chemotaxis protein [Leptospiraceae bacterium]HMW59276.1 methyl-accepting chemotaxis protein [Leptospiraceae bacterium]HMX55867.1 methyl-accepting chemotaxis protein [Leptospiraceae bacterium]HNJ33316.1 methyl-accepting chemotaxis protein [Leptospiraceae bacterium]